MESNFKKIQREIGLLLAGLPATLQKVYNMSSLIDIKNYMFNLPLDIDYRPLTQEEFDHIKYSEDLFGGYIAINTENRNDKSYMTIHIICFYPEGLSDENLKRFTEILHNPRYIPPQELVLFIFLHEMLHVLHGHWNKEFLDSLHRVYVKWAKKHDPLLEKNEDMFYMYANFAEDYYINGYLLQNASIYSRLGSIAKDLHKQYKVDELPMLYDQKYDPTRESITVHEILEDILNNLKIEKQKLSNGAVKLKITDNTQDRSYTLTETQEELDSKKDVQNDLSVQEKIEDLENSLNKKIKGSGSKEFFESLGAPLKVKVDWVEQILTPLQTFIKEVTDNSLTTWYKLKNKYRHLAKLPTQLYIDNKVDVIISIDQSASMSNKDLRKINYVVNTLLHLVNTLYIIIHDDGIVYFKGYNKEDISKIDFNDVLGVRRASGGTSHREVFEKIVELSESVSNPIYLSFSDNYSDIEENFSKIRDLDLIVYWVKTKGGRDMKVPGYHVDLETGEIQYV